MSNLFYPGALVFDIGAHYGESVDKFATHHRAGTVISVEACFENYMELVKVIADNKYPAIPIHAAVWSDCRIATLSRAEAQTGLTTMLQDKWQKIYPDAKFAPPQHVPTITLDVLAARFGQPAYVKIDVEGAELYAMRGMSFKPNALSFEFHNKYMDDALQCLDFLIARGYQFGGFINDDVDMVMPTEPIEKLRKRFIEENLEWGNITVA